MTAPKVLLEILALLWGGLIGLSLNSDIIIVEEAEACFRRLFSGKRVSERHVRSSLPAVSVDSCQQECSNEKHFTCEGFNYRFDVGGVGRGSCELVSIPSSRLDPAQDFFPDRDYDYYERDRNGPPGCNPFGGPYGSSDSYGYWGTSQAGKDYGYGQGGGSHWNYNQGQGGSWSYAGINRGDVFGSWAGSGPGYREPTPWKPERPERPFERPHGSEWHSNKHPPPNYEVGPWTGRWTQEQNFRPPPGGPGPDIASFGQQECFVRARAGFRLDRIHVKQSHAVPSLYDCELQCSQERRFVCLTFSFRYSLQPSYPQDNCLLSASHHRDLDSYTDLLQDRDYDVYIRNEEARACAVDTPPPFQPDRVTSECFRRVRSGQRLDRMVVRDSLNVPSVVECEVECLRSRYFTCRIFSFRYGSPTIGGPLDSCLLSDWPLSELRPIRHIQDDLAFELYERGSFGHGCELNRPPPIPLSPVGTNRDPPPKPRPSDDLCYVGYGGPARLLDQVVKVAVSVPSEPDCKAECNHARDTFKFYCAALSYQVHSDPHDNKPNCLLTDIEQRDLRPGVDYVHEAGHWLFAWNSHDVHCEPQNTHLQQDRPYEEHFPVRDYSTTWRHFTVSGLPCRYGSVCTENHEAGFWSCELEGGDAGAFDYCCRPGHQCGYSEGYSYPWCYVGSASRDQWRPCSDRYYPYPPYNSHGQGHGPSYGGYHGHGGHGGHGGYGLYDGYRNGPTGPVGPSGPDGPIHHHDDQHYYEYGAPRYWPVAYLHREAPPNSSYSSSTYSDKRPGLEQPPTHMEIGIDNYVDVYRSNYGKNMNLFSSINTTHKTAERNFVLGVSLTSKPNDKNLKGIIMDAGDKKYENKDVEKIPSFEVVDEKDDTSSGEVKMNEKDEEMKDNVDSSSELPLLAKLQPRFVQPRGESKVIRSVMRDSKAWRWTLAEDDLEPVKILIPVDFHRKSSQLEPFHHEEQAE